MYGQQGTAGRAQLSPVLAGVFVSFPSFLLPGVADGSGPRTTDLLNLTCAGLLVLAVLRSAPLHRAIYRTLLVWALTLPWIVVEIALADAADPPVQRLLIRWILCGCSAYLITVLVDTARLRTRFLFGLLAGVVLSSLTLVYDFLTFSPEDVPIEQLVNLAIYDGKGIHDFVYRAFGIFGHPNGAAGCVLVGVPVLLGAIEEKRAPRWSILAGLVLMAGMFYLTKSRGPLAVSAALMGCWLWSQTRGLRLPLVLGSIVALLALVAAGGLGSSTGGNVLLERFLDVDSISVNAGDRWWTIATSLDLMLRNPLGMGSGYVELLETATGTSATHNAYLELALMGGVPLALFVVIQLVRSALRLFTPWRPVEAWLAAYLLGIFAFESYFLQVNISLLTLWLVTTPARSFRPHAVRRAAPSMPLLNPAMKGLAG